MIADPQALADLEASLARTAATQMTFAQALAWYEGALAEVRALRPDFDADWMEDLESDFAIARAVNRPRTRRDAGRPLSAQDTDTMTGFVP